LAVAGAKGTQVTAGGEEGVVDAQLTQVGDALIDRIAPVDGLEVQLELWILTFQQDAVHLDLAEQGLGLHQDLDLGRVGWAASRRTAGSEAPEVEKLADGGIEEIIAPGSEFLALEQEGQEAGRRGEGLALGQPLIHPLEGGRVWAAPGPLHELEVRFNGAGGRLREVAPDADDAEIHRAAEGLKLQVVNRGFLPAATQEEEREEQEGGGQDDAQRPVGGAGARS